MFYGSSLIFRNLLIQKSIINIYFMMMRCHKIWSIEEYLWVCFETSISADVFLGATFFVGLGKIIKKNSVYAKRNFFFDTLDSVKFLFHIFFRSKQFCLFRSYFFVVVGILIHFGCLWMCCGRIFICYAQYENWMIITRIIMCPGDWLMDRFKWIL